MPSAMTDRLPSRRNPRRAIAKPAVFLGCLGVVAGLAKRLPVRTTPEQIHVAAMRDDVIYDCRLNDATFFKVLRAQRILEQLPLALAIPLGIVSALVT